MLNLLANDYKTELVGNLIASQGEGLGIMMVHGGELFFMPYAAKLTLYENSKKLHLTLGKRDWRPYKLRTVFEAEKLVIEEEKTAVGNIILSKITLRSSSHIKRKISVDMETEVSTSIIPFQAQYVKNYFQLQFKNGFAAQVVCSEKAVSRIMREKKESSVSTSNDPEELIEVNKVYAKQQFIFDIEPSGTKEILIAIELDRTSGILKVIKNPSKLFDKSLTIWKEFNHSLPHFNCSDPFLTKLFYYAFYVLQSNLITVDMPQFKKPFTAISKFHYYHHWFWDSAFAALSWQWCNNKEYAFDELEGILHQQWKSGLIPHEVFLFKELADNLWHSGITSWVSAPPVHALVLWDLYEKSGDDSRLKFIYDCLLKYDDWLWDISDPDKDGLSSTRHVLESSWDDNPRWDRVRKGLHLDPWVESVDRNILIYLQRKILLQLGSLWGRIDKKREANLEARLAKMKESFSLFWNDNDGFFYDITDREHCHIQVKTPAGFYPLLAPELVSQEQRRRLLSHLTNPAEFWTGCPLPSVAADHPTYKPDGVLWRGTSWPNVNWMIINGLIDSGERKTAARLLAKFMKSIANEKVLKADEMYDSQTGQSCGVIQYGWGTLTVDMVCRFICGVNAGKGKDIILDPLDIGLDWFEMNNLEYRGHNLAIKWRKGCYSLSIDGRERVRQPNLSPIKASLDV